MKRLQEEEKPVASKRVKTESTSIVWEWEDDGHIWKPFSKELTSKVENAFKSNQQKLQVLINDLKFDIMFDRMVQRNSKTFWERRIRANIPDKDGGVSGVYGFVKDGKWETFNHSIQRLIFAANLYQLSTVSYSFRRVKYTIDLNKMELINSKTKNSQKVYEEKPEDIENDDAETKPEISETKSSGKKPKERKSGQRKKVKKEILSEDEENGDEDERKTKDSNSNDIKPVTKSFSMKGKAPVDTECFAREKYNVYYEGDTIYDALLNQTNLKNNNNKFYLMQLLQNSSGKAGYAVWYRWGRVGLTGQTNLINFGGNLEEAKEVFCKKFSDKTKNEFSDRKKFKKVQGKYDLLKMDYKATNDIDQVDGDVKDEKPDRNVPDSKLDVKLQNLIELICNVKEMEEAVLEMKYDSKKAPLGKLTKEQIKAGYKALQKIDKCITNKTTGQELILACDAFYTRVPHCFGMQRPPVIRTKQELSKKIELLETLGDIEIAMKVINEKDNKLLNPIDQHYIALHCSLAVLKKDSEEFKIIDKYTQNTHAKTHNQYSMEIMDVFEITANKQNESYVDQGNKMLLWHGSRLTNWVGILSQGLRIAPPEAPVTGYMFGKGIYFADMSSKSANYCYPTRSKNVGCVLLCEVSLGTENELLAADYDADKLPAGSQSTKGLGKIAPKKEDNVVMSDGVVVPLGIPCDTGVKNPDGYTLNYNEYVVYDTKQENNGRGVHF